MSSSLTTCVNSAKICHLLTVSGSSPTFVHMEQMAVLIHSISACVWLGAPCMSHLTFYNLCLNERWAVIDDKCSVSSMKQIKPILPHVPESQKPSYQGFPLFLWKLLTQINQLHLGISSIHCVLSHIGSPLGMLPRTVGCSCFAFCCTVGLSNVGTCGLIMFIVTVPHYLIIQEAGFNKAMHVLLQHRYTLF